MTILIPMLINALIVLGTIATYEAVKALAREVYRHFTRSKVRKLVEVIAKEEAYAIAIARCRDVRAAYVVGSTDPKAAELAAEVVNACIESIELEVEAIHGYD